MKTKALLLDYEVMGKRDEISYAATCVGCLSQVAADSMLGVERLNNLQKDISVKRKKKLVIIMLVIILLFVVGRLFVSIEDGKGISQTTTGNNSPVIHGVNGNINITGTDSTGPRNKENSTEKSTNEN